MRISVNLASRPFVELRPLYAKLRLAVVAFGLLAVVLGVAHRALNTKANASAAKMNALKARTLQYQQERQRNEARMRQPQNRAVLDRSQFLNAVFAQKSFSWTAVMMDLERVLPAGVQVTSIEPSTSKSGEVNIRLRVRGERDRAVELVRNLEKSQRFIAPRLAGEATQAQETHALGTPVEAPGGVEFDITSGYNPLSEAATPAKEKSATLKEDKKEQPVKSQAVPKATPKTSDTKPSPKGVPR
jgi:type IV pilus assembly protein PilN